MLEKGGGGGSPDFINGQQVVTVQSYKYLSVHVDSRCACQVFSDLTSIFIDRLVLQRYTEHMQRSCSCQTFHDMLEEQHRCIVFNMTHFCNFFICLLNSETLKTVSSDFPGSVWTWSQTASGRQVGRLEAMQPQCGEKQLVVRALGQSCDLTLGMSCW